MPATIELRRAEPTLESLVRVVNNLVDIQRGNNGGRINLDGYSGNVINPAGGEVESADNFSLRIRNDEGNHVVIRKSDDSGDVLFIDDNGLGLTELTVETLNATTVNATTANVTTANAATLNVSGTANLNGPVNLGDNIADLITIVGTLGVTNPAVFSSTLTVNGGFVANGNSTLGNAASDLVVVTATSTFLSPVKVTDAATKIPLYVDPSNNRTIVGSDTAMGSDTTPALQVVGRLYVAPESANDFAFQIRRVSSATVGWNIGMTSTADLVFKDDATVERFRVGDGSSTYQAIVTGDLNVTDDAVINGDGSVDRLVVGATTFSSTESLRVNGATRLESGLTVTAGGANITGTVITSTTISASTGNLVAVTGALIANNNALAGTEKLRVSGTSRLEGATTITTGGLTITAGGLVISAGGINTAGGFTLNAGSAAWINITNPSTAATAGALIGYLILQLGGSNVKMPYYNP